MFYDMVNLLVCYSTTLLLSTGTRAVEKMAEFNELLLFNFWLIYYGLKSYFLVTGFLCHV